MSRPLLIADGDIPTTHLIARVIREAFGDVEIVYPPALSGAHLDKRIVIISRLCLPELSWLPDYLNEKGISYSYFLDDNFFELDMAYDRHNGAFYSHPATRDSLARFINRSNRVIVMSELLAADLRARFPAIEVCAITAPIDLVLIDSQRCEPETPSNQKFRVGYPSTRRLNVSELLTAVVTQALVGYGDQIEFEFMGWMPEGLYNVRGVHFLPAVSGYDKYVSTVMSRQWDAALAPLTDTNFENCKTNLKYLEYAAFGIPGVYSNVPLFASSVKHGRTGLLADNRVDDWLQALDQLLSDVALRHSIAHAARADVEKCHAQSLAAAQLREHLGSFTGLVE